MKKILSIFLTGVLIFSLAACAGASETADGTTELSDGSAAETGTAGLESAAEGTEDSQDTGVLVAYFSWADNAILAEDVDAVSSPSVIPPGNVQQLADWVQEATGGDLFEITPADPYTADDLNWTDPDSRVVYEYENPDARDIALATDTPENWEDYDTVFIGYPIWWGVAAWPVSSFVAANDFTGKTVIPFCTSSSSGLGESGALLEQAAGTGEWLDGQRFSGGVSESDVAQWLDSLALS